MSNKLVRYTLLFAIFVVLAFGLIKYTQTPTDKTAKSFDALINLDSTTQVMPLISPLKEIMDIKTAYDLQKKLVLAKDLPIHGFKAALTAKPAQKKFGVNQPLTGVLLAKGLLDNKAIISTSQYSALKIETEIGFVISKMITQKIEQKDLANYISFVVPAIELPSLKFDNMKQMQAIDLIAANSGSNAFIYGDKKAFANIDLNKVNIQMSVNNGPVYKAQATDIMGDQYKAITWLINTLVEQGWILNENQVLITGAIGKVLPGQAGEYKADFGELGNIEFTIVE